MTLAGVKPMSFAMLPPTKSRAQRAVRRRTSEKASTANDAECSADLGLQDAISKQHRGVGRSNLVPHES